MFRRNKNRDMRQASEYATCNDFQKIFSEDMAGLHLLAFLLTADQRRAEEVFVAGLEDSINSNPVFRQWARSWSKRAIIKRAIKSVAPVAGDSNPSLQVKAPQTGNPESDALVASVVQLSRLDRFAFVLSVLEGYSNAESAALLGCSVPEVIAARSRALQHVSDDRRTIPAVPETPAVTWKSLFAAAGAA